MPPSSLRRKSLLGTLDVVERLGRHGLAAGPDGFEPALLEAAIANRGWRAEVDERRPVRSGYARTPQFSAVIVTRAGTGGASCLTRGRGETAEAALAQALAKLLA